MLVFMATSGGVADAPWPFCTIARAMKKSTDKRNVEPKSTTTPSRTAFTETLAIPTFRRLTSGGSAREEPKAMSESAAPAC
jgi:hypothetical protein